MTAPPSFDYDYIVIGSGFGGSVSALRLSQKGYKVLVLEKGKWLKAHDFPKTNWNLKKWLWLPQMRFFGLFKLTFFRHVATLSGVGVGGGSLVYANTLPVPKSNFFRADTWAHLADWEEELQPHYMTAKTMLGANPNPYRTLGDTVLEEMADEMGKRDHFDRTNVAVFFGKPGETVPDPYFGGKGPERTGCNYCGGCMLGCRYNSKNTLDKNYLHLAQLEGAEIQAESEVVDVRPLGADDGSDGYKVTWRQSTRRFGRKQGSFTCRGVVFSGGVLGTISLLLKLKQSSLPKISDRLGTGIRTNNESLIGVTALDGETDFSKGVAIGSILHTDDHSHLEPVRYSPGNGFWRLGMSPLVSGGNAITRLAKAAWDVVRHPIKNFKMATVDDWSKRTQILLFMQSLNSTLRFTRGLFGMKTKMEDGPAPTSFIPEANKLARRFADKVDGQPAILISETVFGIPTTAHILGGATMGSNGDEGVIDSENRVFGYQNMMICDGSMISANIGVNPSLTITALSERAMSKIPPAEGETVSEETPRPAAAAL
ncbi:MAG: GMC oxidoreductase [Acidobacteriota bacterium]|nr:GMC oxidoreductase [Acidobacteriota bacterium]